MANEKAKNLLLKTLRERWNGGAVDKHGPTFDVVAQSAKVEAGVSTLKVRVECEAHTSYRSTEDVEEAKVDIEDELKSLWRNMTDGLTVGRLPLSRNYKISIRRSGTLPPESGLQLKRAKLLCSLTFNVKIPSRAPIETSRGYEW